MGLFTPTMKWIYLTKLRYGIDFSRTVTLGRQYCEPSEWRKAAKQLKGTGGGMDQLFSQTDIQRTSGNGWAVKKLIFWIIRLMKAQTLFGI